MISFATARQPRRCNVYSRLQLRLNTAYCVDYHGNCSANMTLTQSVCMATRLLRIQGRAISMKLHPQKVLAAHGHAMRNVQTQLQSTVPGVRLPLVINVINVNNQTS